MLLGYDENGDIKFIFTDENYLQTMFPNNRAKISNFWKVENHGLKEFFITDFNDTDNIDKYQIVDNELREKKDYIRKKQSACSINHISVEKREEKIEKKEQSEGSENLKLILSGIANHITREIQNENRDS